MLLTLNDIQSRLDEKFKAMEPTLTGFRLVPTTQSPEELQQCEAELGVHFPVSFKRLLLTYDIGRLTIGPTAFWSRGDYFAHLVKINRQAQFPWWGNTVQPSSLILIAGADGWTILLDTDSGKILAFRDGADWRQASRVVARDFELFLRGIATVFFGRMTEKDKKSLTRNVAEEVGGLEGLEFWTELAE